MIPYSAALLCTFEYYLKQREFHCYMNASSALNSQKRLPYQTPAQYAIQSYPNQYPYKTKQVRFIQLHRHINLKPSKNRKYITYLFICLLLKM